MPNPYHDDAGRFTSRDEMAAAVERLEKGGDRDAWMELRVALADADAASARAELNFHRAVSEFASDSKVGFEKQDRSTFSGPSGRDFSRVINAAGSSEQLSEAWQVIQNAKAVNIKNVVAILRHPDVDSAIDHDVLDNLPTSMKVYVAQELGPMSTTRANLFAFNSFGNGGVKARIAVYRYLSEADRRYLRKEDPAYVIDEIEHFGWREELREDATGYSTGFQFADPDRYGVYGQNAVRDYQQGWVAARIALADDTDEGFDSTLESREFKPPYIEVAARYGRLDGRRAGQLAQRMTLGNYADICNLVQENPQVPALIQRQFGVDHGNLMLPGKPTEELKGKVADLKREAHSSRDSGAWWAQRARDRYFTEQARYDAHEGAFNALERKEARYKEDFLNGKIGEKAYSTVSRRLENARRYTQLLATKAAVNATEDQLVRIEFAD